MEYDFVVAPGADPKQIRLAFDGADRIHVDKGSGDLILTASDGFEVRQVHPRVYQQIGGKRVEVAGGYELLDNGRATFALAKYDHSQALIINPTVNYVATLGGSSTDIGMAIALSPSSG